MLVKYFLNIGADKNLNVFRLHPSPTLEILKGYYSLLFYNSDSILWDSMSHSWTLQIPKVHQYFGYVEWVIVDLTNSVMSFIRESQFYPLFFDWQFYPRKTEFLPKVNFIHFWKFRSKYRFIHFFRKWNVYSLVSSNKSF